ncbi:MAG: hypothetical protein LIP11_18370 [Clostridiales bacterium]|nr:hypothetical protein [Clostridiales bacterium]
MVRTIKNQFRIHRSTYLAMAGLEVACFGAGMALLAILMKTAVEEGDGSFPLGTMLAVIGGGAFIFINAGASFNLYFNTEVAFGCTRRQFLVSALLQNLLMGFLCAAIAMACAAVEDTLNAQYFYPQYTPELVVFPYFLRYGIVFAVALTVLASFCGALVNHFGQKAQMLLLVVWLLCCWTMPGVTEILFHTDAELGVEANGIIRGIASAICAVPQPIWPCAGVLLLLAALVSTWALVSRETVK